MVLAKYFKTKCFLVTGGKMKTQLNQIGKSALSIINSTIIVLPFMIFIQIANQHTFISVLPFVLFYTFRMTGIFLIRGIKTSFNSYTLLHFSLYCGSLGCLLGVLGTLYFPLYIISGILLGLSAAWLPMSNTSVTYFLKKNNRLTKTHLPLLLGMFLLIGCSLFFPAPFKYLGFFLLYGILYLFSFRNLSQLTDYEVDIHDLEGISYKYLVLFFSFFSLIFFLRASRLLFNHVEFDYFIYGFFFLNILYTIATSIFKDKIHRKISADLTYLTYINGAVGNYLFLFCSLYAAGYYGHKQLFLQFYLPYVFGIILAAKIRPLLGHYVKQYALLGILFGLITIVFTPFFPIGVLLTSTFKGALNAWITAQYEEIETVSEDKRIWVKYSLQNIGSILHQFLLMLLGSFIILDKGLSLKSFFVITSTPVQTLKSMQLMTSWNVIATSLIILIILIYGFVYLRPRKR